MKSRNQKTGFFSLEIFLLEAPRTTSSYPFLNEITKTGFWISCLYKIMVMYQGQLQDLPAFLKATSALVATVSINAGVMGKGCNEASCRWKFKQSQIRSSKRMYLHGIHISKFSGKKGLVVWEIVLKPCKTLANLPRLSRKRETKTVNSNRK